MSKKYISAFIGVFIAGQASIGMTNIINDTDDSASNTQVKFQRDNKKLTDREHSQEIGPEVEVVHFSSDEHNVKVTYKYEKKKNFTNIENNVAYMKHHDGVTGGNGYFQTTQPGKIARAISGKLLVACD